jgi:hypothetical protein
MLDRIADGRTDLVFDWIAQGGPARHLDSNGVPLIRHCAYYGDVSAIRYLLAHGETLDSLGENFDLGGAAFHGHWRLCQFVLENGADPNRADPDSGETPLHAALCKPLPVFDLVVEVLLAHGADPHVAAKEGAETGGFMRDVRTKGETPLHRAAAFGSLRAIEMLLEAGAAADARDAHGDSPLTWASWHHRPSHILAKLCFGPHRIHPSAVQSSPRNSLAGWRGMEKHLAGKPRPAGPRG